MHYPCFYASMSRRLAVVRIERYNSARMYTDRRFTQTQTSYAADDPSKFEHPHLDLRWCVAGALVTAGVRPERIEQVAGCTSCDRSGHFSHRRDQGRTGRHLAFVASRS